jgi:hypothetical protein
MYNLILGNVDFVFDYDCHLQVTIGDCMPPGLIWRADREGIIIVDTGIRPAYIHGNGWKGRQRIKELLSLVQVAGKQNWLPDYKYDIGTRRRRKPFAVDIPEVNNTVFYARGKTESAHIE